MNKKKASKIAINLRRLSLDFDYIKIAKLCQVYA